MPSRRRSLVLAASLLGLAGCVSDEPATESSMPTASSTTEPSTPPRTGTETPRTTNTCAEQFVFPDIEVENERSTEQRVSVALVELPDGSLDASTGTSRPSPTPRPEGEVLFETTYTVEADGFLEEDQRIFRDATPEEHDYRFDCTHDGETVSLNANAVASVPQMYGVHVEIGEDGQEVWDAHADPGEAYNPNCY